MSDGIEEAERQVAAAYARLEIAKNVLAARRAAAERTAEQTDYDAMIAGNLSPVEYDKRWGNSRGA